MRLARALRAEGVGVALRDELDAAEALSLLGTGDRGEVYRALRASLKIPPHGVAAFDRLFPAFWTGEAEAPSRARPHPVEAPRVAPPRPPAGELRWDPDTRTLHGVASAERAGEDGGASPAALLRRALPAASSAAEVAAMERVLARLARRLATRRSRRLVPAARGRSDLRRSFRRALRTEGELLSLARRAPARQRPRLVFLCDTSGSMDAHARFLLAFVLALRRAVPQVEVFAFNTELVHLTRELAPARLAAVVARLGRAVPDWSGGTRIGDCLAAYLEKHAGTLASGKAMVVVLSDGLDGGDPETLAGAAREVRRRADKLIWLNPLAGDARYQPLARGMRAALPFVDLFASAHDVAALERLVPVLAGEAGGIASRTC